MQLIVHIQSLLKVCLLSKSSPDPLLEIVSCSFSKVAGQCEDLDSVKTWTYIPPAFSAHRCTEELYSLKRIRYLEEQYFQGKCVG